MQISTVSQEDLPSLSLFLASAQQNPETYVGYVSENQADILEALGELELDLLYIAQDQTRMAAFLGADLDDQARAWIYGSVGDLEWVQQLWQQLSPKLQSAQSWLLFADARNESVKTFAEQIGCPLHGTEQILELQRNNWQAKPSAARVAQLSDFSGFIQLHDSIYPNTYYSGSEILERVSKNHQLFVFIQNDTLQGYSYAELSESGEASLEFIGVAPAARGLGIGQALMTTTLEWVFSFANVKHVSLTVNSSNQAAIAMYQKLGFTTQRQMVSYRKLVNP